MSRDEKRDEMSERLAGRFSDDSDDSVNSENIDDSDQRDNPENPENIDDIDNIEESNNPDNLEQSDETESEAPIDPKEAWTGRMVYVPTGTAGCEDLLDGFDGEYDRLQYETDWEVRKQLHYYPVLIQSGVDALQEMSGEEFTAHVEELGLR
jgi:hypothetical protein